MQTPPQTMPSSSTAIPEVDGAIWRAVAGAAVRVPAVNAYVYYFPQGQLEQCSAADGNYDFALMRPWIPCQVISVRFLSDPASDQVFSKILLQPLQPLGPRAPLLGLDHVRDNDDVVVYAKVLTRSDANNGGGFSVPRFCADMILPQLNFAADPPVQNLVLRDTHNNAWEFRHIYRGTPRRHLLTTGWSKFVNAKRLVAGDSVVFMKKRSTGELFVGIRRAERFGGDAGEALAAIQRAVGGLPFEVVYFPKVGSPDFVVMAEKVKESLRMRWSTGMKVRMGVETDDASRVTLIQGVVSAVETPNAGIWCGSPWRMLQVNWDDPESSHNMKNVSPWEVEYVSISPLIDHPDFPNAKRFKFWQESGMLHSQAVPPPISSSTPSIFDFSQYPTGGMQGARQPPPPPTSAQIQAAVNLLQPVPQNLHPALRLLQPVPHNMLPAPVIHELPENNNNNNNEAEQELISVSTVLSIGSSYSDIVSPVSQGSAQSTSGQSATSFQLFGKTIQAPGDCSECGGEGCDLCT